MSEHQIFSSKSISMTVLMTPDKANFSGNVHGGEIMKLMDQVAYACSSRYCGTYAVTLYVDQVLFKEPIRVGDFVTFLANINYVGNTSMEVGIKVIAEDLTRQSVRHTNSCFITMISMKDGKPNKVPPLELIDEEDIRRFEQGKKRKEQRLKNR